MAIELVEPQSASTKRCTSCDQDKPLAAFHRDRTHGDGYKSRCRDCRGAGGPFQPSKEERAAQRKVAEERSLINRNAILRLINSHRAEFESYVNAESIRIRGEEHASRGGAWIRLA